MHGAGLTVGSLANDLRTHPSTVSRWLSGSVPRGRMLEDLAEALGVSVRWLRDGVEESSPDHASWIAETARTQSPGLYKIMSEDELSAGLLDCAKRITVEKNSVVTLSLLGTCSMVVDELRERLESTFRKKVNFRDK